MGGGSLLSIYVSVPIILGHYISDTYDMNRRMWYSWNDSHGHRIDWDELRRDRERTGYLFFYAAK